VKVEEEGGRGSCSCSAVEEEVVVVVVVDCWRAERMEAWEGSRREMSMSERDGGPVEGRRGGGWVSVRFGGAFRASHAAFSSSSLWILLLVRLRENREGTDEPSDFFLELLYCGCVFDVLGVRLLDYCCRSCVFLDGLLAFRWYKFSMSITYPAEPIA